MVIQVNRLTEKINHHVAVFVGSAFRSNFQHLCTNFTTFLNKNRDTNKNVKRDFAYMPGKCSKR